jgi:hypothetical protein
LTPAYNPSTNGIISHAKTVYKQEVRWSGVSYAGGYSLDELIIRINEI